MEREILLSKLTMEQVLDRYAPRQITKHRCACPLHGGKDNNMSLYKDSFYCWVCGAAGDFIKFVSLLCNISYGQAMRQIDQDFGFGIFAGQTPQQRAAAAQAAALAHEERRKKQQEKERQFDLYRLYLAEWHRMTQYRRSYRPAPGDRPHPLFVIAIRRLPYIEHWLDSYNLQEVEND